MLSKFKFFYENKVKISLSNRRCQLLTEPCELVYLQCFHLDQITLKANIYYYNYKSLVYGLVCVRTKKTMGCFFLSLIMNRLATINNKYKLNKIDNKINRKVTNRI